MMNYKQVYKVIVALTCGSMLSACSQSEALPSEALNTQVSTAYVTYDEDDAYQVASDAESIDLDAQSGDVEINKAGTYLLQGTLSDGSILIDVGKEDTVRLILNNAHITSSSFAALYSAQAKKVIISLPEGTNNTITDASTYTKTTADEVTSAIFVKDDLTINGTGTLHVTANFNDAITSKDTLKLMEGNYVINAQDDGIVGRDFLYVKDGEYTLQVAGDGFKTTYDSDDTKGDMIIENGTFQIHATNDGIQSEHKLTIYDGSFTLITGGGSVNSSTSANANQPGGFGMWNTQGNTTKEESASAKGLKSGTALVIEGGNYQLDTSDDAIHANQDVSIAAGSFTILSGDDGIHADNQLTIQGGTIDIQASYEGLEGANIDIYSGYIQIVASDDGINTAGGNDDSQQGHPGQDNFYASASSYHLNIHGGTIQVQAAGDGLDSNGSITINGGSVVVNGPTNGGDSALDYDGECTLNGGTLIAIGMSSMAQAPSTSSLQPCVMINLSTMQSAQETLYITDVEGNVLLGIAPTKQYNNVVISTPAFVSGQTMQVYTKGSGGILNDAGYMEAGISNGTLLEEITLTNTITTIGSSMGMNGKPNRAH